MLTIYKTFQCVGKPICDEPVQADTDTHVHVALRPTCTSVPKDSHHRFSKRAFLICSKLHVFIIVKLTSVNRMYISIPTLHLAIIERTHYKVAGKYGIPLFHMNFVLDHRAAHQRRCLGLVDEEFMSPQKKLGHAYK